MTAKTLIGQFHSGKSFPPILKYMGSGPFGHNHLLAMHLSAYFSIFLELNFRAWHQWLRRRSNDWLIDFFGPGERPFCISRSYRYAWSRSLFWTKTYLGDGGCGVDWFCDDTPLQDNSNNVACKLCQELAVAPIIWSKIIWIIPLTAVHDNFFQFSPRVRLNDSMRFLPIAHVEE